MSAFTMRVNGHTVIEHWIQVPYDYFGAFAELSGEDKPNFVPGKIELYAREIVRDGNEKAPRLLYLEGGPGNSAPRPSPLMGWMDEALNHYRLVLMDQRGTGNSWPMDAHTISMFGSAQVQGTLLYALRQDSIIRDAEMLRRYLQDDEPWSILGQSYGGFCALSYLSDAPKGLREVMITGGLPSLRKHATDVYRHTYVETSRKNKEYFERYPQDEATTWFIAKHLADVEEILPTGERLTPGRFRMLGLGLGSHYGFEKLHYLLEDPFRTFYGQRRLRPQLLAKVGQELSATHHPLYWGIHETIYAQTMTGSINWAAHRVRSEFPEFYLPNIEQGGAGESDLQREKYGFRFTGEHVYPWQFEQDPALTPMRDAAQNLAFRTQWKDMYNADVLAENQVPVAAYIYYDDMYVPREFSLDTAERVRGLKPIITNKYQHDGLRVDGKNIIRDLLGKLRA
ncbi:alpha/beta fold hydrolase [Actinotignum urinale]|uniref:Alpha/beta fold hydrolase n=1 Tax=Actinotignum urinale TaxID=190146 RepID=A0AAW9HNL1_9ACTO|nr:alpha/beta fold hydrolase [Actinotignum urinale]MDY5128413.1 alpha/beta fold hydrolase [Actinotignum urinale]MDY5133190.1 alpha/beta fold hydrolase [Actinotignum urinale]MDY5151160.1 alpha/beta fold hydrolase [Actinotignum urinale]MDY5155481.1 alpha/beta fold hydrolase [Actinotignum urinale]WIK59623.1 alpha/beta fold hydrolase [Actinotignum urinale]